MFNNFRILYYIFIIFVSILIISSALYIEHMLLVPACKLCLYQRVPYLLSVAVCFFGIFFPDKNIWLYLLVTIFIFSITLSGYHLGIESNIFKEFSGCTNGNLDITDKNKLLESFNQYLPNCKNVNFKIFGFSLATINFIISIALTLITTKHLFYEKNF